jgi:hypothetical protein
MEIKIKGTSKAGILAFNLSEPDGVDEMKRAQQANHVGFALQSFFDKLRSIRKYEKFEDLPEVAYNGAKSEIYMAEEYYRVLLLKCLREYEVENFLEF